MKFSVVGHLVSALPIIEEIHRSHDHQLGCCWLTDHLSDAMAERSIPLSLENSAEAAFLSSGIDTVVLAIDDTEEILRLTRAATQAERNVVFVVPNNATTAFSFELHLLWEESQRSIIAVTGRMQLADFSWNGSADVQQLVIDIADVPAAAATIRARQLQALDCLQAFGLRYTQVTAIDALSPDGAVLSRLLTLSSAATSEQRLPPATITLKMQRTPAVPTGRSESIQIIRTDGSVQKFSLREHPEILPHVEQLCQRRELCGQWMESFSASLELADAVEKSLRRRRTVDVHFDTGSERGVFKSQMTAMGCGVLTWMILGMIGFLIVARLTNLSPAMLTVGRAVWIAPLVLFLAVQLLLPLTRNRSRSQP